MAEIISIKVNVNDSDYKRTTGRLLEIQKYVDTLNKTPIHIKIDDTGFEKATKQITAYNNSIARMVKAENELAVAKQKTAQAQAKAEAEAWKAEQQEIKLATAQVNRHTQTIRQQTEIIKGENQIALQKEKTATVVARTAQEEAKANTALVQGQARLAVQQEKTATATAQAEAAQRRENAAMQEGTAASSLLNNSLGALVLQYVSMRMIINRVISAFGEALNTMKEVDSELVTIQKTTGYSGEQLDRLTDSAYKLASAYGRTATEILNAASVYARAGFKDNLEDMTELSALLQNVGDLSGEAAAKFLVATNAAWKLDGSYEKLLRVIDGLNQQTNEAAVDMNALTSGITVAGSVFSNAGESVQTFAGLLGAGVALTQRSGGEIGRGLRTIAMNIRQIKGELEDGEIIDEESISDAAAALHSVGISVADANGELRLTSDVLKDLAEKWGDLTTAEQSYIAQSLAGKRQANILNALMNNWQEAERQMTLYANGAGSAMKENEIYLDSWEAKTKQLDAAWTEFVANLVNTDMIKGALDGIISVVQLLDTEVGRALVAAIAVPSAIFAIVAVVAKLKTAIAALNVTMLSNPVFAAIALGTLAIYGVVKAIDAITTSTSELEGAAADAKKAYEGIHSEVETLISKGEELTEVERTKLALLQAQEDVLRRQARDATLELYNRKYGKSGSVAGSPYEPEYNRLQSQLETASWKESRGIRNRMAEIEAQAGAANYDLRNRASGLVMQHSSVSSAMKSAGTIEEFNRLQKEADELMTSIVDMATELGKFDEELGDDFPEAGKAALDVLSSYVKLVTSAKTETQNAVPSVKEAADSVDLLREKLKDLSDSADTMDTAIGGVTEAVKKFGANSVQTYDAMKALEAAIPGSTDKLYDFQTASLLVDEALFEDKESVLDLIDAMRQVDFSNAINEAYRAADAAWDMAEAWTAVLPMMGGVFANAAMASSAYLGSLQQQRRSWTDRTSALRQRADYRPSGSGTASSGGGKSSDSELERLKNIVSLRKAELAFLQAKGASEEEVIAKNKEIQAALHDQAEYMRSIGANEEDILALSTEWWKVQNDIVSAQEKSKKAAEEQLKLQQEMFDQVKSLVDTYYDKIVSDKEKELSLEERILAVQQAEAALANAQAERTVRYYNAATGQWEWQANAKNVKSAQDALKKAQDDLNKYQREQAWKEFKSAWEYVSEQIKAGAMTFKEAYDYMYDAMKGIQDKYGVDLSMTLEDSIGGFKNLNYGIDGLTQEVADSLGNSVGVLRERLQEYETAVDALKQAMDDAAEKVKSGEFTIEEAYTYLRERAKEISERYGIDMTGALDEAIAGMDKTNMSIDDLWKSVVINLMKVNSSRWFDANAEERAMLHAQNEYLGNLIGATYDPSGYWSLNGQHLYDPKGGGSSGASASGAGGTSGGTGTASRHAGQESAWKPATANASTDGWTIRNANGSYKVRHETPLTEANEEQAALIRQMEEAAARGDTQAVLDLDYQLRQEGTFASVSNGDGPPSGIAYSISGTSIGGTVTLANGELWDSGIEPGTLIRDADGKQWEVGADGHTLIETDRRGNNWYDGWSGEPEYDRGGILRGIGGIKRTKRDEIILPPDLTKKMLDPVNNDLSRRGLETIRNLLGMADLLPQPIVREETMNTGDTYTINGVSIGEQQAKVTTVYELARLARAL